MGGVGGARGLVSSLWRTQERMFVNSSSRAGLLKLYHAYEASLEPIKIQILLQQSRVGPEILFFCQADGMLVLLVWGTHSVTRQNLDLLARLAAEPTP